MPLPSSRVHAIPLSGIREMMNLAMTIPDVLRLEIGDPDFMTPAAITQAATDWAQNNRMGYPPNAGIPQLREAIAGKVSSINAIASKAENVNVTIGATGALYLAMLAVLEPGDEILVPDPGWAGYSAMVGLAGAIARPYRLRPENGFQLIASEIEKMLTPSTRAILVNSPSNPTGALNDPQETRALVELAERRGIWIIADECYDQIVFDMTNACVGAGLDLESAPVISAFSFSKTYAMTGWRIGYLVASNALSQHVTRMQAASVASASVVSQMAGLAALQGSQEPAAEMLSAYRHRRDVATGILDEHDIACVRPDGALYVFVDIRSSGLGSRDFATGLLRERAVCTTPGVAFGESGDGFIRVSLACSETDLREGLTRFADFHRQKSG